MNVRVVGPVEVPVTRINGRHWDPTRLREFWSMPELEGCFDGRGCYIFGVSRSHGVLPVYVGRTRQRVFGKECFSDANFAKLHPVLSEYGRLVLLLLQEVRRGRSNEAGIRHLENQLIALAAVRTRHPEILVNQQGTKRAFWKILGVDSGRARSSPAELALEDMMGL